MKRVVLQSFIGIFCFAIITSCNKEVKTPYSKTTAAAKATTPPPVAQTAAPAQSQGSHTCGSQSGGGSQSGTYSSTGY